MRHSNQPQSGQPQNLQTGQLGSLRVSLGRCTPGRSRSPREQKTQPGPTPSPVPMASSLETARIPKPRRDEASFCLLPEGPSSLGS